MGKPTKTECIVKIIETLCFSNVTIEGTDIKIVFPYNYPKPDEHGYDDLTAQWSLYRGRKFLFNGSGLELSSPMVKVNEIKCTVSRSNLGKPKVLEILTSILY